MYRRRGRAWLYVVVFLVLLVASLAALAVFTARRPFPRSEGTLQLPGLQAPAEVYRDSYGVPHIYAANLHDLFLAQGFVHAQDRFWQMEFWRRIGAGRLAEALGPSALDSDRFIRTLGWHRTAAEELERLDPETRAVLEAYAEGVNAYLAVTDLSQLGLEFTILRLQYGELVPEPWAPQHTLTWAKVMAWDLGGNMDDELLRAYIADVAGASAVGLLVPPYRDDHPLIVPHPVGGASLQGLPGAGWIGWRPFGFGDDLGSNNWVIAGSRSATGAPLLANDPHLGIQMPSIWYEVGLHCAPVTADCPLEVVGASFAGAPGVIIGHNAHIAWGVTNLGPDVQDLFIEQLNPEDPGQYLFEGQWRDLEIVREEIHVAGQDEPEVILVRRTHHGPIINDVAGGSQESWSFGWQPLALSWTALDPGTLIRSVLLLNHATNWQEFREALRYWDVPSQNFVYADVEGNIGYQAPGRIPIRAAGDGSLPVPGWSGEYEWVDWVPYDQLPRAFNPPEGYIVTANNAVVSPDYPYFLGMDWDAGYRARRIVEMIEAEPVLGLDQLRAMQADSAVLWAREILPYVFSLTPEGTALEESIALLRAWDGQARRDSDAAAIFEMLRVHLIYAVFEDELGTELVDRSGGTLMIALVNLLPEARSPWFDDRRTPEVETREDIVLRALEGAIDEMRDTLGDGMVRWRWGSLHHAVFEHQTLGRSGLAPLEWIFNRGPVEVDGAIGTLNNTGYSLGDPYSVRTVPSYRQMIDLADFNRSLSMHTTGQSGHAFHPHYDDMIPFWADVVYHPMLWDRVDVTARAEAHLILQP